MQKVLQDRRRGAGSHAWTIRSAAGSFLICSLFLGMPRPAQAGKLSWLDDVVRRGDRRDEGRDQDAGQGRRRRGGRAPRRRAALRRA